MTFASVNYLGVEFRIKQQQPAWFAFGIWKSGSTLLFQILTYLAQRNDANWVSIPDDLFQKNIDFVGDYSSYIPERLIQPGNIYGGFRIFPRSLAANPTFQAGRKVLMVRDPRDALVSQYFSFAKSHYLPEGDEKSGPRRDLQNVRKLMEQMAIDEFVIQQAPAMNEAMLSYRALLADPQLLVLRYEDVIFSKSELLTILCEHFGWQVNAQDRADILHHVDIRPDKEDAGQFIRKVTPGDHVNKLKPETIAMVNQLTKEAMDTFAYSATVATPLRRTAAKPRKKAAAPTK